ncbi:MAG: methyltransferase domain-containing protein [Pyrinomonadaceae bacterium]
MDIGTGDGRFVSAAARTHPNKFFIGIDANVKPLEKPSMKATRNTKKGGLPNVMFVQAAIEFLPDEFAGVADEIHIHFPWGSLLRSVTIGETNVLNSLRQIAAAGGLLEIVIGVDPERDKNELLRLDIPDLTLSYFKNSLSSRYNAAGFETVEIRQLSHSEWSSLETSWARKLSSGSDRVVTLMIFRAN